jgi:hypothetical protein
MTELEGGVKGTPTFFIKGERYDATRDLDDVSIPPGAECCYR